MISLQPDRLLKPQAVYDMASVAVLQDDNSAYEHLSVGTRKSAHESLFALFGLVLPMSRFRLELGPLHVAICRDPMQSTPRISNHHRHLVCNLAKTYLDQMVWVVTERTWSMLRSSGWGKIIRPQWVHRDIGVAQEVNRESASGCWRRARRVTSAIIKNDQRDQIRHREITLTSDSKSAATVQPMHEPREHRQSDIVP